MASWKPEGVPFAWVPAAAFDLIEQGTEHAASAVLVYVALARIASRERSDTFAKPVAYIAKLAFLDTRTVQRRLPELEGAGLVSIKPSPQPGRGCNTFTLAKPGGSRGVRKSPGGIKPPVTGKGPQGVTLPIEYKKKVSKEKTARIFAEMREGIL